jgi:hypothetical protein
MLRLKDVKDASDWAMLDDGMSSVTDFGSQITFAPTAAVCSRRGDELSLEKIF